MEIKLITQIIFFTNEFVEIQQIHSYQKSEWIFLKLIKLPFFKILNFE